MDNLPDFFNRKQQPEGNGTQIRVPAL